MAPQPLQEDFIVLTFAVHEAPNPPADRVERAASLLFVKDAFSWPAALFTPLWLIVHRLWWPLLGYLALVALMLEAGSVLAPDAGWIVLGLAALNLLVGLEAAPLRMWSLARRGDIRLIAGLREATLELRPGIAAHGTRRRKRIRHRRSPLFARASSIATIDLCCSITA